MVTKPVFLDPTNYRTPHNSVSSLCYSRRTRRHSDPVDRTYLRLYTSLSTGNGCEAAAAAAAVGCGDTVITETSVADEPVHAGLGRARLAVDRPTDRPAGRQSGRLVRPSADGHAR